MSLRGVRTCFGERYDRLGFFRGTFIIARMDLKTLKNGVVGRSAAQTRLYLQCMPSIGETVNSYRSYVIDFVLYYIITKLNSRCKTR